MIRYIFFLYRLFNGEKMKIDKWNYEKLDETVYTYETTSNLKAFVVPTRGYSKKFAALGVHYGAINKEFIISGNKDKTRTTDGIAHFLEHKLFEQKDGNVMEKFCSLGAKPNAATTLNHTVFHFTCTDGFRENLCLLLDFVQNPYITEECIVREKGIIGQEILMNKDNPHRRVLSNLLSAFYVDNPAKIDITGTVESISNIDKDLLDLCFNVFYHPSNMVLIVVGDVDPLGVFEEIEAGIKRKEPHADIIRIFPQDSPVLAMNYTEQQLEVSNPIFRMGFKDNTLDTKGIECMKREAAVRILLDMLIGKSSELYNDLYREGLVNSSFRSDYTIEECYAFSKFGSESADPLKVMERFSKLIVGIHKYGLDETSFNRLRNVHIGRFIRQLNSLESIARLFVPWHFKGAILFDYLDVYNNITFEYINYIFKDHFNLDSLALSVIRPLHE